LRIRTLTQDAISSLVSLTSLTDEVAIDLLPIRRRALAKKKTIVIEKDEEAEADDNERNEFKVEVVEADNYRSGDGIRFDYPKYDLEDYFTHDSIKEKSCTESADDNTPIIDFMKRQMQAGQHENSEHTSPRFPQSEQSTFSTACDQLNLLKHSKTGFSAAPKKIECRIIEQNAGFDEENSNSQEAEHVPDAREVQDA